MKMLTNIIKWLKPTSAEIKKGQLALNIADRTLWSKGDSGQPFPITGDMEKVDAISGLANVARNKIAYVTDKNRGGMFVYDASRSAENDGGVVFNGWVRQFDGIPYAEWFGAISDDTSFAGNGKILHDVLSLYGKIQYGEGAFEFKDFYSGELETDKNISISSTSGATFVINGDFDFKITNTKKHTTTINSNPAMGSSKISVADAANIEAGDVIAILSTEEAESQWNYKKADTGIVRGVNGNDVLLSFALNFNYIVNAGDTATVSIYKKGVSFNLDGINITCKNHEKVWNIQGFDGCSMRNIRQSGSGMSRKEQGLVPYRCVNVAIDNIESKDMLYPILVNSSRGGSITNCYGESCHHIVDTAAFTSDLEVKNIQGSRCQGVLGFHPSFNINIDGVIGLEELAPSLWRTCGGSYKNAYYEMSDDLLPNYYMHTQEVRFVNCSRDPYIGRDIHFSNIVVKDFDKYNDRVSQIGGNPNANIRVSECSVAVVSQAMFTSEIGSLIITGGTRLRRAVSSSSKMTIGNVFFNGKNRPATANYAAIDGNKLGTTTAGTVNLQVDNASFENYDLAIYGVNWLYKWQKYSNLYFKDVATVYSPYTGHVNNTNQLMTFSNCNFHNISKMSPNTDPYLGMKFVGSTKTSSPTVVLPEYYTVA